MNLESLAVSGMEVAKYSGPRIATEMMFPFEALPLVAPSRGLPQLSGVRILDLSTSIAGPYATQLLGDLGATVVKVEKPCGGDDSRQWGPPFLDGQSLWFLSVNRNKQSLALDVASPAGRDVLAQLLRQADVLVLNMTPRVQDKLGLSWQCLKPSHPRLVHASLTGFGLEGERRDLPCYDLVAEGFSGIMDLTGERDGEAQKVGTPAADLLAGQDLAMAVLAALFARERTGEGTAIDVSMLASMTRFTAPRAVSYLGSGEVPRRSGGKDSVIAIYQVFEAADGPLSLGLGNDGIWHRFWNAVGDPAFGDRAEFATNAGRRQHRDTIVARIAGILGKRSRDEWLALFAAERIPAGPINRVDEIARDAQLIEQGVFFQAETSAGRVPQVGLGIAIGGERAVLRQAPPALGEGGDAVLRDWLDMDDAALAALRAAGTLAQ
jgi:crotonobetainyl-CoA:carnitine CoA-transferase CaiB-like acyl-CoA transferase